MRTHRFYTGDKIKLTQDFWLRDEALLWQWGKVLRFREGQEVVLFDGTSTERLYKITGFTKNEAHLEMVTEMTRHVPTRHVYLFWSLLKKDNNDLILQKCTELGVTNFVPLLTERSIRDKFNHDRALKIVREAGEQCGRSDIPAVREPVRIETALKEYASKATLYICQQGHDNSAPQLQSGTAYGVFIGPEGGWSDAEKQQFADTNMNHVKINDFVLRAETAAVVASALFTR